MILLLRASRTLLVGYDSSRATIYRKGEERKGEHKGVWRFGRLYDHHLDDREEVDRVMLFGFGIDTMLEDCIA